jgi:enoyl-CoA hydratase
MSDTVLCEIHDRVALLTLNRPAKLNALNYELMDRVMGLLDTIERLTTFKTLLVFFTPAPQWGHSTTWLAQLFHKT